jgi:hypothetical protein
VPTTHGQGMDMLPELDGTRDMSVIEWQGRTAELGGRTAELEGRTTGQQGRIAELEGRTAELEGTM